MTLHVNEGDFFDVTLTGITEDLTGSELWLYLIDLAIKKGEAGRMRMVERLRASQGTPNFTRIYREYVKGHGMPADIQTLILLLDVDEEREALKVIDSLEAAAESAPSEQKSLLKSRLRNLEMSTSSDALADAATDLIGRL